MGRVSYTEEYGDNSSGPSFPRLKLEANQIVRILCPEEPYSEYVHDLRLPEVKQGVLQMEERKFARGTELVPATQWLGTPICLGLKDILKNDGLDPTNCPACAAATDPNSSIKPPKRRYAMNVVQYAIMPNGTLARPFNAKYVVWAFTARLFDQIVRIVNERLDNTGQPIGLQNYDLRLGPPEDPVKFQKYPIQAQPDAAWRSEPGGFQWLQALSNAPGQKATEEQLKDACGKTVSRPILTTQVQQVVQAWAVANNLGQPVPLMAQQSQQAFGQQPMQQGFADIMQQGQPQFAPQFPQQGYAVPQPQFPGQPVQPAAASPFAPAAPVHPLEAQAAVASAAQQAAAGSPFAPQPQAQPQQFAPPQAGPFAPQPAPQQFVPPQAPQAQYAPAGGLDEFHPQTTSNPPERANQDPFAPTVGQPAQAPPQQFAPPAQSQQFAPPQAPFQQPGIMQPPQPQQGSNPGDVPFASFFPDPSQPQAQPQFVPPQQ